MIENIPVDPKVTTKDGFMRDTGKIVTACVLAVALFLQTGMVGEATSTKTQQQIDSLKKQQQETQDKLDDTESEKKKLEAAKTKLENYLLELNNQFAQLSAELDDLETQLTDKQEELNITEQDLEEAKAKEEQQYADMKKRIQFMYENGNMDYLTLFLQAGSINDFLNQADYASELVAYDRRMLTEFRETKEQIEATEARLQQEKEELETLQAQVTEKQQEVNDLVQSTGTKINEYTNEIAQAQKLVDQYEGKLESQQNALDSLIAKAKKEEDEAEKKKAAAAASKNSNVQTTTSTGTTNNGAASNVQASDLDMLAAIIYCEAGSEGYDGQLAVGAVVMNRVRSSSYPNSIMGVIYQSGQFSPVASGRFILALSQGSATSSCGRLLKLPAQHRGHQWHCHRQPCFLLNLYGIVFVFNTILIRSLVF